MEDGGFSPSSILDLPSSFLILSLSGRRLSAHFLEHDPGDVGRIRVGGEEDVGGGDLLGLRGAAHRAVLAELTHFLR